jgi:uncharacterized circularly permuted ATP-grasp superfamily protein/uncharacterized alpha-E superfamily protein
VTDLLTSYEAAGPGHDEMLQSTGAARAAWAQLADLVDLHSWEQLSTRRGDVVQLLEDHGVQYGGEDSGQAWNLDPLPVLLDETEWHRLETGLAQRSELLDEILTDVYGPRRLLSTGLLPAEVILGHPGFLRAADGITLPGDHQLFLTAADIARNADGSWQVIADRTQAPSGMGYAMEDRRVLAQVLAGLYRKARIHRIGPFFHAMRLALRDVAPVAAGDVPRIALLTPGPYSETAFDQAYLSAMLGFPLVEGGDLVVDDGRLWMRSMDRLEPVDVLLRRVDAEYCDPLDLRGDSRLGVPGLLHAARQGGVSVVNTFGSGVLENAALLTFLPRICRELRGQELLLSSAVTYWCGERSMCSHVIANLERLVVKPTARSRAGRSVLGWTLTNAERADLAARISAEPHAWVGQEPIEASTAPTVAEHTLEARAAVLRTFAVARPDGYQVMSGALARVAPHTDAVLVSNSSGAVAKDVWVLSSEPYALPDPWVQEGPAPSSLTASISPRVAEDMYWYGRYAERAEATIRLLRAVCDRWDDFHGSGGTTGGQALDVLQSALAEVATPGDLRDVLLDQTRPGTVAYAVHRMTGAATAVRDQLSSDSWPAISALERALARERAQPADTGGAPDRATLARLLESLLALQGLDAESMVRDVGWFLDDAGHRLERAQFLVDILAATLTHQRSAAVDSLVLESVLIANESIITYSRRYQTRANVHTVLDLLLLDGRNPRSLVFQLDRLRSDLAEVRAPGRTASRDQLMADIRDLLDELDTGLVATTDDHGLRRRLVELLDSLGWRLRELDEEITRVHFVHPVPSQWLEAGTWGAS